MAHSEQTFLVMSAFEASEVLPYFMNTCQYHQLVFLSLPRVNAVLSIWAPELKAASERA